MRACLIVLDSAGIGHAPDAADYGDGGANTIGHILEALPDLRLPALRHLGLDAALAMAASRPIPPDSLPSASAVGVLSERSAGKDTTTGHWELAGIVLEEPFAVFREFPRELVTAIEREAGVTFIGNFPASGTAILEQLGAEHLATGHPILYTSADSVLQIAAHEDIIPPERLYALCAIARKHADPLRIGRVIARPFLGVTGNFRRTAHRHDFSLVPPASVLDALDGAGIPVTGVGKIGDIFAGRGIARSFPTGSNAHGMESTAQLWDELRDGLLFVNLVDFDMLFGHRRDVPGYGLALAEFDAWLTGFLDRVIPGDLLMITADHGNDPTWPGTDHTRERVPLFQVGGGVSGSLGISDSFAQVAATLARHFGVAWEPARIGR